MGLFLSQKKLNFMTTGLKTEISETLCWFADMDIKDHGKLTESTKEMFSVQGVDIPEKYLEKNN